MPFMIFRQGTVVIVVSNKGIVLRSHDVFSTPRAVALEAKLRGDVPFATEWVRDAEPKPPAPNANAL